MSPPRKKDGCINWDKMIAAGENPNGCIAQTADGTVRNYDALGEQEWRFNQRADGARWNDGFQPSPGMYGAIAISPRKKRK